MRISKLLGHSLQLYNILIFFHTYTFPALTIVGAQLVKVLVQNEASLQSPVNLNDPQVYLVSWSVSILLI